MRRDVLDRLNAARQALRPIVLATDLVSGEQSLIESGEVTAGELEATPTIASACEQALRLDKGTIVEHGDRRIFLQVFNPPLRLIIIGAVHIAQPLASMATLAGYGVTVVDPRGAFATPERFPGIALNHDWPDEAVEALAPDARTALVALTHDPKLDDPALKLAVQSPCFYIAALGSKKTHAGRIERLTEQGIGPAALERIHGPAGLSIAAKSPAEIAISVMAQMTQVLRAPKGEPSVEKAA